MVGYLFRHSILGKNNNQACWLLFADKVIMVPILGVRNTGAFIVAAAGRFGCYERQPIGRTTQVRVDSFPNVIFLHKSYWSIDRKPLFNVPGPLSRFGYEMLASLSVSSMVAKLATSVADELVYTQQRGSCRASASVHLQNQVG